MKKLTLIALASVFSFGVLAHEGGTAPEGGAQGGTPPVAAPAGGGELAKGKTAKPAPKTESKKTEKK